VIREVELQNGWDFREGRSRPAGVKLTPRNKIEAVDARQKGTVIQVAWPGKGIAGALGWARLVDPVSGESVFEPEVDSGRGGDGVKQASAASEVAERREREGHDRPRDRSRHRDRTRDRGGKRVNSKRKREISQNPGSKRPHL
jgi:hypothetical protein